MSMKLYGADVCPFVQRVRIGLGIKKLDFEYVAIDLANKPEWYDRVLPSGKVPLLEDDSARVWESLIILEYLEDSYPEPALYPESAAARARARLAVDRFSNSVIPLFYKLLRTQDPASQQQTREALVESLGEWELPDPFFGGERPGMVDLALYPWFDRWCVLRLYRELDSPGANWDAWSSRMSGLPEVRETTRDDAYFIEQYAVYAVGARADRGSKP